jgi:hypothetical protein
MARRLLCERKVGTGILRRINDDTIVVEIPITLIAAVVGKRFRHFSTQLKKKWSILTIAAPL